MSGAGIILNHYCPADFVVMFRFSNPDVKKDATQVSVNEGNVTIGAELPEAVDENASEAKYADGVLTLILPKRKATSAKRLAIG